MFLISWKFALIKQVIKARVPARKAVVPYSGLIERFHIVCARHHQPRYNVIR